MTKRIDAMMPSGIREIFEKAATMNNAINLSIGQPDLPVPEEVKEQLIRSIREDETGYTPSVGLSSLVRKISGTYSSYPCNEGAIITPGVTAGIFLALSALVEEGEEVIIPEPYFVVYPEISRFLGIRPVFVDGGYGIDIEGIRRSVGQKTKAIILNSPCNPTGYVIPEHEVREIIEIAKENDLWIISDEVYSIFDFDGRFFSPGAIHKKTIVLDGFSKSHSMTGLRAGYAVGPAEVIQDMIRLQQYTFVCAPSIVQHALAAVDVDFSERVSVYKKRRDLVTQAFSDVRGFCIPSGAFYACIPVASGNEMAERLLKRNVLVVPGRAFSRRDDFIRISFAVEDEMLKKGLQEIKNIL